MAATHTSTISTEHDDMIHDAQLDYYSKKLATCSSDRTIRIYDVSSEPHRQIATLQGHDGPVWQVNWAHPKFGVLLDSCSYDGRVIIFRESPANTWTQIYVHEVHASSVSSIEWAPYEFGLCLACASSDGSVSVLTHHPEGWKSTEFRDSSLGCNSVSWAPYNSDGQAKRLVTASCDYSVKIWRETPEGVWEQEKSSLTKQHDDWVRDVAWAPSSGLPTNIIASCSEDRHVFIFSQEQGQPWECVSLPKFEAPVWRVSWSITGHVLAVSSGDHQVTLWKQSLDKNWRQISTVGDNGALNAQQ